MSIAPARARDTAAKALLFTWMVTAAWDFACASALSVFAYHSTFARLWQGVASTVLGADAMGMGALGVATGLALHLTVALVWSAVFVAGCLWSAPLRGALASRAGAIAVACAYGPLIWFAMSLVVIPLATGRPPSFGFRWWVQVVAHIPFVTIPLVFAARHALRLGSPEPASGSSRRARDIAAT